jgi:hypothetical protein
MTQGRSGKEIAFDAGLRSKAACVEVFAPGGIRCPQAASLA